MRKERTSMADRLQAVLSCLEKLPPEVREEVAAYMEDVADTFEPLATLDEPTRQRIEAILAQLRELNGFIAASALVHNLTLVTTDSDFTHVPGLSLQPIPRDALRR